jgi:hypothetical protein
MTALSLAIFASKLAPTRGLARQVCRQCQVPAVVGASLLAKPSAAFIQHDRVIVDDLREQARSYKGRRARLAATPGTGCRELAREKPEAPHFSSMTALSLAIFASKLVPTRGPARQVCRQRQLPAVVGASSLAKKRRIYPA